MQDQRDAQIVKVLDNQIRRDDGLIHREIRTKLDAGMEPIHEMLADLRHASQQRDDEDRRFRQEVLTTLAQIQGAMSVTSHAPLAGLRTSTTGVLTPPPHGTKKGP